MIHLSLEIENKPTLQALIPLLELLNIKFNLQEDSTMAEPEAIYHKPLVKKSLQNAILRNPIQKDKSALLKIINEGITEDFDTQAMLQHIDDCRKKEENIRL